MLENDVNLVRKIAWKYAKKFPGAEFDELFSEACLAYLEAEEKYDMDKAQNSTFMWHVISNHLQNVLMKQAVRSKRQHPICFEDLEAHMFDTSANPEMALIKKEEWESFMTQLSDPAQTVCRIIMSDLNVFLPIGTPKKCRGAVKEAMRELGYTWDSIWNSYAEIKEALSEYTAINPV
jgi:RNA polymerase sigma factor (sigma-70 family)